MPNRSLFDPAQQHLLKPNHVQNSSSPPLVGFSASDSGSWIADQMTKCHVSSEAARARRSCIKAGVLKYPTNPCRTVEAPSVGKAYMIYRPSYETKSPGWDCNVTAVQSSLCHNGLSKSGHTECPVTSFDGFHARVGAESPAYHDDAKNLPTGADLVDPWSKKAIPARSDSNCPGLLLTLTGTEEPSKEMQLQLQLAEITICDYLARHQLPMPNCDSKTVNETVAASNVENSKPTPARKANCEIRLHIPIPENETEVHDLSLTMALAAFSELCSFGGAQWWKDHPGYKTSPSCEINHGEKPLLARLAYVGKDNYQMCPWLMGPGEEDDWFECADGTRCNGEWHGWECCAKHGGRVRCPKNYRFMCESRTCGGHIYSGGLPSDGGQENCCLHDCSLHGGWRACPFTTLVAPLTNPADFESKVERTYNLGFPGIMISILALQDLSKMRFMQPSVVRQNFFPSFCLDFECVVNEYVR